MLNKILLGVIGVLLLGNIIQFCSSSIKKAAIETQSQQIECIKACLK